MIIYNKPIDDKAVEALAEVVEELVPVPQCPLCGAELYDDGWDDCRCFYDLIDRD